MKANHIPAASAGRLSIADLARYAARKLSGRAHATADDRARALGWEVTETSGRLGLSGRRYRDPRFDARAVQQRQPGARFTGRGVSIPPRYPAHVVAGPPGMPHQASPQVEPEADA